MQWRKKKEQPQEELPTTEDQTTITTTSDDGKDVPTTADTDEADNKKADDDKEKDKDKNAKAPLSNYWRILSYGSKGEHGLMLAALVASAASGVALPLMQIVFGNLTGTFNSYSTDTDRSQSDFNSTLDRYS